MSPCRASLLSLAAFLAMSARGYGEGDAARGARLFSQCMACHSVAEGEHLTGPSLAHVWNRKAATSPGFQRYSDALKSKNIVWDEATLERWLANPEAFVPGTSMTFAGLKEEKDRR